MIILPGSKLFNRFSKKGRPSWQERYERRERLLMFVGPLMWTRNDLELIGPIPPEIVDDWWKHPLLAPIARSVSSMATAFGSSAVAGPSVALSNIFAIHSELGACTQGFRYETGGGLSVTNTTDSYIDRTNEWVASGDKATGLGSDYEAYADETTYTQGTHTGGWTDSTTYYTISADLQLQCVAVVIGSISRSLGNTAVREIADTGNSASATFSIFAEREDLGGILL